MSALSIQSAEGQTLETLRDHAAIASVFGNLGERFERWEAGQVRADDTDQDAAMAAYRADVVALGPEHPQKAEMRQKSLAEHTHADFEARFFVDGRGLFYLHIDDRVYLVLCEKGDLISVPSDTTPWLDMGTSPDFKCIRFFTMPGGWVADFTGSDVATRLPDFDSHVASLQ